MTRKKTKKTGRPKASTMTSSSSDEDFVGFPSSGEKYEKCRTCNQKISKTDKFLPCRLCLKLFHTSCHDIPDPVYVYLNGENPINVRFVCDFCVETEEKTFGKQLESNNTQLNPESIKEVIQDELKAIATNFDAKIDHLKSAFISKIDTYQTSTTTYADALTKNLSRQSETKEVMAQLTQNVESLNNNVQIEKVKQSEAHLKELKKSNVILFKMPEAAQNTPLEAYKTDFKNVLKVIDPNNQFANEDIKDLYRIPCKQSPRPIVVKFSSPELKQQVLKMQNLTLKQDDTSHRIHAAPDRTKKEQEDHKALVSELRRRRDNGEDSLSIRGGKIVENRPFRFKPQDFWGNENS